MCFASSIVEAHRKLFIASPSDSCDATPIPTAATTPRSGALVLRVNDLLASTTDKRKSDIAAQKMSRSKSRLQEVCGDCGASDPSWASINRGILLCSDCCSVHRSLGRHISIVKSLRQGTWEPSVLNFVNSLNVHGANSVWEHHLLDLATTTSMKSAGGRIRKPTPKDPLHPVKSDFIKAKHVNLQFVLKPNLHDDDDSLTGCNLEHELSKQLHASVRTSNLETSLRLLVQGADPNFFHEEKRSTSMHVAAKFGQASQIELLIVYGANINAIDGNGLTPLEVAKANNHSTIAERLLDAMYDVTDRLITFLGCKKPDHTTGRHLIIPDSSNGDISEQLKIARGRLQLVPNKMFEELVMDLFDEVDRRENEAIWATSTLNGENVAVPFLPANPFLSATRNQGRQKLARFSRAEFAGLLTDVLIDARRRQNMANLRPMETSSAQSYPYNASTSMTYNSIEHDPNLSDDEPIYDPVASDDDYAPVPPMAQQPVKAQALPPPPRVQSHYEMETLRKQISEYVTEINQLKTVVQKLSCENSELKSKFSIKGSIYDEPLRIDLNGSDVENEPHSLPIDTAAGAGDSSTNSDTSNPSSANNSNQSTIKRPASMYERRAATSYGQKNFTPTRTSMYQIAGASDRSLRDEVIQRTEQVTQHLKELIKAMQEQSAGSKDPALGPYAERIRVTVTELIAVFSPTTKYNDNIRETLKQLSRHNIRIQHECENLQNAYSSEDKSAIPKTTADVRDGVYYIASAMRALVNQVE